MFNIRDAAEGDLDFICNVNKSAMKDYIIKIWGKWDDDSHRKFIAEYVQESKFKIITLGDQSVGAVAYSKEEDKIIINEIQILPEFQNKGIGTLVLKSIIAEAENLNIPVELKVLKINNLAQKLYTRLGFTIYKESDTHYFMKRESNNNRENELRGNGK